MASKKARKKFDINNLDVDAESSDDSKFDLDQNDAQKQDESDLVDKFSQIGKDYAGSVTGSPKKNERVGMPQAASATATRNDALSEVAQGLPNANSVDAYHAQFHNKVDTGSDEDSARDVYGTAKGGAQMQASMYARDFGALKGKATAKNYQSALPPATIVEEDRPQFSSISNVRGGGQSREKQQRSSLMKTFNNKQQKPPQVPGIPTGLIPKTNKFQLATHDQWKFEPDPITGKRQPSGRLGESARLSKDQKSAASGYRSHNKDVSEIDATEIGGVAGDYDTSKHMSSVAAKKNMATIAMISPKMSSVGSMHHSDKQFADALRKSREMPLEDDREQQDEVLKQMQAEMAEGEAKDVNPLQSRAASRDKNGRLKTRGQTAALPGNSSNKKRKKVKGNLGLAIQHGAEVADAVQLNTLDQNFDEDDILADEAQENAGKAQTVRRKKGDDDFGMSSDEEQEVIKRNQAIKEAEEAAMAKRMHEAEIKRRMEALEATQAMRTKVKQEKEQEIAEKERIATEKRLKEQRQKDEAEEAKRVELERQLLQESETFRAESIQPTPENANENHLTPIDERNSKDETTGLHLNRKGNPSIITQNAREFIQSPGSTDLRSEKKLITNQMLADVATPPPAEPDRSQLLNIEDSSQNIVREQSPEKAPQGHKPSFLGRIGAMMGLMDASKFADTHDDPADDGRVGSASTTKSRQSKAPETPKSRKSKRSQASRQSEREVVASRQSNRSRQSVVKMVVMDDHQEVAGPVTEQPTYDEKPVSPPVAQHQEPSFIKSAHSQRPKSRQPQDPPTSSNKSKRSSQHPQASPKNFTDDPIHDQEPRVQTPIKDPKVADENEAGRLGAALLETIDPSTTEQKAVILNQVAEEEQKLHVMSPDAKPRAMPKGGSSVLQISERQKRQQARLLKATKEGTQLNDSYYEEVSSENNNQAARNDDPYDINQKHGYESSSTAHMELTGAASKLKRKLANMDRDEVVNKDGDNVNLPPMITESKYIDPEKDETHALFASKKMELQSQGLTLKKGDINALNPHMGKQAAIDTLRFLGAFIYLSDLCVKIAYFRNTKWISEQVRTLWLNVFKFRIAFVLFYHAWFIIFRFCRSYYLYSREIRKPKYKYNRVGPAAAEAIDGGAGEESDSTMAEQVEYEKVREAKKDLAMSTMQSLCEITLQAVILPVAMYSGFSRLATMEKVKTNYIIVGLGQELLLHQLPLSLLCFYNNLKLDKPEYMLDDIVFYLAVAHVSWVLLELGLARAYLNSGINLEQRIRHETGIRIKDLLRLGIASGLIGTLFIIPSFISFKPQECKDKYYDLGKYMCQDCTDFHGEECLACADPITCTECVKGHYLENYECHICAEKWPGCVDCIYTENYDLLVKKSNAIQVMQNYGFQTTDELVAWYQGNQLAIAQEEQVTALTLRRDLQTGGIFDPQVIGEVVQAILDGKITVSGPNDTVNLSAIKPNQCIKQAHGFFFDKNNQIVSCKTVQNCEEGACGDNGCEKCIDGYYLEDNECIQCNIPGCSKCSSATQCTECKSDFLKVNEETGGCQCNVGEGSVFPNMITNSRTGECKCEDGYWFTEFGCLTCEELIPGCSECYRTSADTLIPIYQDASITTTSPRQYFVDCKKCPYHDYRQRANVSANQKPACLPCTTKWDGCGYCGSYGNRCTKCLESHVYDSRNYYNPCKPCWCWMGRCTWCRGNTICVKYWTPSDPWPEYDLTCE